LVDVPRLVRRVGADETGERPHVDAVLVFGDQTEPDLDRYGEEQDEDAERAERIMAEPDPLAAPVGGDRARTPNEARKPRGRASHEPPQDSEDQQGQD